MAKAAALWILYDQYYLLCVVSYATRQTGPTCSIYSEILVQKEFFFFFLSFFIKVDTHHAHFELGKIEDKSWGDDNSDYLWCAKLR